MDETLRSLAEWYPTNEAVLAAIETEESRLISCETQEQRQNIQTQIWNLRRLIVERPSIPESVSVNYSVDDSTGTCIAAGLTKSAALKLAQKHASSSGEPTEVYPETPAGSDTEKHPATIVVAPTLGSMVVEALAAYHGGDPDSVPTVRVKGAYRDLSSRGDGSETIRRIRFPGVFDGDGEWLSDRLPSGAVKASDRKCETWCDDAPIGSIVQDLEIRHSRGRRSKAKVLFALLCRTENDRSKLEWLEFRVLRKRPVYEITLPDGTKTEWPRRV